MRVWLPLITVGAVALAIGGCGSSFEAIDRSAAAFNQRLVDEDRCYSRPAPNGQTVAGCSFVTTTSSDTTTTTVTTTDSEGRVTSTTTTRTVNGQPVPDLR